MVISVSSSRNSVPPFAVSSRPGLSRSAPVNAPFLWPNISDSSSGSGRAAQLIGTRARPGAAAVLMDELGDDFLARSALTADEHRGVGRGHFPGEIDGLAKQRRDADQRDLVAVAVLFHELHAQVLSLTGHHDRM